ncbi:hypothetical protein GCM10010297_22560 [Streptomyces malachitofuscus]|nr:hypothetical protein GCM10010297_22560 [Streptomyces malachitofuscus]
MADIDLRSPAFSDRGRLPHRCAGDEDNLSPPLTWTDVPEEASELALLCECLDAPPGSLPLWLVTGIDPRRSGLPAGTNNPGSYEHRNSAGGNGWAGPAPADAPRRYAFHLYALPAPVSIGRNATADSAREVLDRQCVGHGALVALY